MGQVVLYVEGRKKVMHEFIKKNDNKPQQKLRKMRIKYLLNISAYKVRRNLLTRPLVPLKC